MNLKKLGKSNDKKYKADSKAQNDSKVITSKNGKTITTETVKKKPGPKPKLGNQSADVEKKSKV